MGARRAQYVVFAAVLTSAWSAAGEPAPSARLHYAAQAPKSECPDEAAFRALVTARLGRDPFALDAADAPDVMEVEVGPSGNELLGRVMLRRRTGSSTRDVHAGVGECDALVEALASIAALAIDPASLARPQRLPALPPANAPTSAAAPSVASPPPPAPPPAASPARDAPPSPLSQRAVRFAARGAVVGSSGLLPATSMGGEIGVGGGGPHFAVFALGRGELQPSTTSAPRLDASLLAAGIAPCGRVDWFAACLVGWAGVLNGRAPDAIAPSLGSSTVAYVGPRVEVTIPLGNGFAFAPHVDVLVPLVRTTLLFAGEPAWTAPALAGSLGAAITYGP